MHSIDRNSPFKDKGFLVDNSTYRLKVAIVSPGQGSFIFGADGIEAMPDWAGDKEEILWGVGEIAEIGLKKDIFFLEGRGEVFFKVGLVDDGQDVEMWPTGDPIRFPFSGQGEEIVWDL